MWRNILMMTAFPLLPLVACQAPANNKAQEFRPEALKLPLEDGANELLVLGSSHLNQLPVKLSQEDIEPLLRRLEAWRPDMIAVENLSGMQCDFIRQYPYRYKETFEWYCGETETAKAATGLDVPQATREIDNKLRDWPDNPSASERRHLAALFLAGGERISAYVQWLRLPEAERREGDGLDAALVSILKKMESKQSESLMVAAVLAARLKLERVYNMDDHTSDFIIDDEDAYGDVISALWDNPANKKREEEYKPFGENVSEADGVMKLYRHLNSAAHNKRVYESDFGATLQDKSEKKYGRQYTASWETRNLRMASNIREAMGQEPGAKMLVIVGASHKGYLDAYLNQMHDTRLLT